MVSVSFTTPSCLGHLIRLVETGGYYGRAWGHRGPADFRAFVLQILLLLVAPIFLAATVYMSLARIVTAVDAEPRHSLIRPKWLAKIFVTFDVLCFLVQIAGAGMQCTTSASMAKLGEKVTIVGLVLQILVTAYFVIAAATFHRRINLSPTVISGHLNKQLVRNLQCIYTASMFILVRNIFRVAEFAEGFDGAVSKSEAYIYVFDATLMALVVWIFIGIHPGRLLWAARKMKREEQPDINESKDLMAGDEM